MWRCQKRFFGQGVDGLLRDKARPSRIPPLDHAVVDPVVETDAGRPPGEAMHWTGAMMAKAAGISVSSVERIWGRHGLQPHRLRQFKLSNDPGFAPGYATWWGSTWTRRRTPLSFGRRNEPTPGARPDPTGLPLYKRHGTAQSAPLNALDGTVIGRNMARHRHQEFIRS